MGQSPASAWLKRPQAFHKKVYRWFDQQGRKHLPWQQGINPYRVWLSEVMLQQTQVDTVIPYFQSFTQTFPNVTALANAELDTVLHLWTGLGYYTRARNLHKCAQLIVHEHNACFPKTVEELTKLPGIGRSTAGAIVSLAFEQPAAILDGNVKRVLARCFAIDGWPGQSKVMKALWELAETLRPNQRCRDYSQAMMDLGALCCTKTSPTCKDCPLNTHCIAHQNDTQTQYPGKKPKKERPLKRVMMQVIVEQASGLILLEKRPAQGIWGGLWSLPEKDMRDKADNLQGWRQLKALSKPEAMAAITHAFSHYQLEIHPVLVFVKVDKRRVQKPGQYLWYNRQQPQNIGLAAPIKKLLNQLKTYEPLV